ncbi:hypothetical protein GCM10009840_06920 [Pseudolysinimonas kribbensis]|uniref:sigma-70 family RNA polymerase sigma factor n=1 Tax=Pseudolysinimonas kribbensis TaxID=433641 RepID=UPI0031E15950
MSDEELAERARAGDTGAFAELWTRHAKAGLAAARQFRSIADPDDIVSEAYLQILRAVQRGGGPREAFRPYLYRTIRNVALGWVPKSQTVDIDDVAERIPSDLPDIETATLENTITVRAFRTLPERWQTILWYTEVEGMEPAEAAPYLGLTANGAAALAYRARDGLKKAWLQAHVSDVRVPPECRWTTERMADYNRGALTPRARARFDQHLDTCTRCSILLEEIDDVSGRLAAILLPVTLGAGGAALLAEKLAAGSGSNPPGGAHPTASSPSGVVVPMMLRAPTRLVATIAAAAVVIVAGAITAVAAAGGVGGGAPVAAPSGATATRHPAPATRAPRPDQTSVPLASPAPAVPRVAAPPARPAAPRAVPPTGSVASPPPNPPDVVAPLAPVLSVPAEAALLNTARPPLAGSGEPGATVEVERLSPDGVNDLGPLGTAVVGPAGSWTMTPDVVVPDGTWRLRILQLDRAGNASPPTTRTLTVDTVALPPVLDALPASPLEYLPLVQGSAEPAATVTLRDDTGATIGTATGDNAGRWSIPLPDLGRDGATLTAVQRDPAGNVSAPSDATAPLSFQRPTIDAPADGAAVPSAGAETVVTLQVSGTPGERIQILIDGVWTGNVHTLGTSPIQRVTPGLPDGPHTIGVRYFDPATGRLGSVRTVAFTIG